MGQQSEIRVKAHSPERAWVCAFGLASRVAHRGIDGDQCYGTESGHVPAYRIWGHFQCVFDHRSRAEHIRKGAMAVLAKERWLIQISVLGCLLILGAVLLANVGAQQVDEYQVKAAFICNFPNFVEWPPDTYKSPADPFSVCVLGRN